MLSSILYDLQYWSKDIFGRENFWEFFLIESVLFFRSFEIQLPRPLKGRKKFETRYNYAQNISIISILKFNAISLTKCLA